MFTTDRRSNDGGASNGTTIIAIVGSLTAVSALFVAARLYVRIKLMRNVGLDDYLIVLAMVRTPELMSALKIGSANDDQDLWYSQLGHLQRSSRIGQRATLRHSEPRATTECDQVHHSSLLPWYTLIRDSKARSSCLVDQAHGSESSASAVPLVFFRSDDCGLVRMCHHTVCTMHTISLSVGLLHRG